MLFHSGRQSVQVRRKTDPLIPTENADPEVSGTLSSAAQRLLPRPRRVVTSHASPLRCRACRSGRPACRLLTYPRREAAVLACTCVPARYTGRRSGGPEWTAREFSARRPAFTYQLVLHSRCYSCVFSSLGDRQLLKCGYFKGRDISDTRPIRGYFREDVKTRKRVSGTHLKQN